MLSGQADWKCLLKNRKEFAYEPLADFKNDLYNTLIKTE